MSIASTLPAPAPPQRSPGALLGLLLATVSHHAPLEDRYGQRFAAALEALAMLERIRILYTLPIDPVAASAWAEALLSLDELETALLPLRDAYERDARRGLLSLASHEARRIARGLPWPTRDTEDHLCGAVPLELQPPPAERE